MGWYGYNFEPSRRREVKGGIKAVSRRGRFGETWWGQRWIDTLEGFDIGARLGRGKSYARSGQVLSIDIAAGRIEARVQGSRPSPYRVVIELAVHGEAQWAAVAEAVRAQPFYAAKLLAGEMPEGLAEVFGGVGCPLFPERSADLETECSCPDWSNPCKHIAAVYYLLAEEFDRDPFLLFRVRGRTRDALLGEVVGSLEGGAAEPESAEEAGPVPLEPGVRYWESGAMPEGWLGVVRRPPVAAALPRRLGKFPFWRGEEPLVDVLEGVYARAGAEGLALVRGEEDEG